MRSYHLLLPCFLLLLASCQQAEEQAMLRLQCKAMAGVGSASPTTSTNVIFQSNDGGQTWQDISAGLPLDVKAEAFFVSDGELLLGATDGVYHSNVASKNINWEKEPFLQKPICSVSSSPAGTMAVIDNRKFFQKLQGTDIWMPIFTDFTGQFMRMAFTAKDGSIFIGSDNGLSKSTDGGKNWKHVMQNGWVIEMVESDGVLLCTNMGGILRSTDGGETWEKVLSEGGVGIDVTAIKGGFAAIDYSTSDEIRHVQTSYDGGKTWQRIDEGLPPSKLISSILQVGDTFYCGHPEGIFRSDDQGKTWNLVLPTVGEKVFNLSMSNGVMYAFLREGGC